jgi:16S rRNA (uracil1498-N3)-methyltransferase
MHRFFLTTADHISEHAITVLTPELLYQMNKVLRFRKGEKIILINQETKTDTVCQIEDINKNLVQTKILESSLVQAEPEIKINLLFPILKNSDKIEFILQKCTELGIHSFTPLISSRTEKPVLPKQERLERIIKEACEQSGRISIPRILEPITFKQALDLNGTNCIADPYTTQKLSVLKLNSSEQINLFIGPEGGFSPEEIQLSQEHKFTTFSLGKLILRAETACIVASASIILSDQ